MTRSLFTIVMLAALASGALAQTSTITGVFEYEDKGWGYNGWTGTDNMVPIRRADVSVLNNSTSAVLGSGSSGQDGSFSIDIASQGVLDLIVRVDCDSDLDGSFQRIRVTTTGNSEYQSFSPVFAAHNTASNLDIGTVSVLKITTGSMEANPFNLFDMGVSAWDYISGPLVGAGNAPQTIRLYWPGGGGSFASGNDAYIADDDGYDDAVILHELGHVVQNMYSDSDNPGGSHFFGDSNQDPALSMGEGYGTFFGSTIMDVQLQRQAIYQDANGASQNGGSQLRARIETAEPYQSDSRGAADELAVACTLFDILDTEASPDQSVGSDDDGLISSSLIGGLSPHKAWWDVFVGPVASASNLNINDAWDGWFSLHGSNGLHAQMEALYGNRRLDFLADATEPNNSQGAAASVSVSDSWLTDRTLYWSASSPPAPGTGDHDWYGIDVVIGSVIDFETRYPGGAGDADTQCDTFIELYTPGGVLVASDNSSGTDRNGFLDDQTITETGTWGARVRTLSGTRRYGRYDLRLSYSFQNFPPSISSGPSASPSTIPDDQTSLLSVTASDANPGHVLSYQWTPLSGGSISGSGPSVTFTPPSVGVSTDFDVQLVVSDNLGAQSAPVLVTVTVTPGGPTCPSPAVASSGGSSKAGLAGLPTLSPVNLPVVPSSNFGLQLSNALPGATAYLLVGLSFLSAPFDLGSMYPTPDLILPLTVSGTGDLLIPLPMADDPSFCGLPVWWQIMVPNDPGAAGLRQTSQTNWVMSVAGN